MSNEETWATRKLSDIATIRISNVDKKFSPSETPIRLCNYMDVYANDYVTGKIEFMEASATDAEIERFGLHSGDVIITKDSESPDDIGIPTVIAEEIEGLVCGYHLAIIRPNQEQIDPLYLANQLSTSDISRYFAIRASGSTRFGLSIDAIENLKILMPAKPEQSKIAEVLSTVDLAIEHTGSLIAKLQRIKNGLAQDLLARGIDEYGKFRSESTHEFKDSPVGRIPVEWKLTQLGNIASLQRGHDITEGELREGPYPVVSSSGVIGYHYESTSLGPNVVVGRKGTIGKVHYLEQDFWAHDTSLYVTNFHDNNERFVYYLLVSLNLARYGTKSGSPSLNRNDIHPIWICLPDQPEQIRISSILLACDRRMDSLTLILSKTKRLKSALMEDILTGKKLVTKLLDDSEVALT